MVLEWFKTCNISEFSYGDLSSNDLSSGVLVSAIAWADLSSSNRLNFSTFLHRSFSFMRLLHCTLYVKWTVITVSRKERGGSQFPPAAQSLVIYEKKRLLCTRLGSSMRHSETILSPESHLPCLFTNHGTCLYFCRGVTSDCLPSSFSQINTITIDRSTCVCKWNLGPLCSFCYPSSSDGPSCQNQPASFLFSAPWYPETPSLVLLSNS